MTNRTGKELEVPLRFYIPLAFKVTLFGRINTRVRCGGCARQFTSLRKWEGHWSSSHGRRLEIRQWLTALQRGITSWTKIRDPAKRRAAKYQIEKKRHSFRVGLWYKNHPDVARRMGKRKLSQTVGARFARHQRQRWRATVLHCGQCGEVIRRIQVGTAGIVSLCPRHKFAWTWTERELFLIAGPPGQKAWATRRIRGKTSTSALRAWETRRARGHVREDCQKAWKNRYARFGASGMTPEAAVLQSERTRSRQQRLWRDPGYRSRQTKAITVALRKRFAMGAS